MPMGIRISNAIFTTHTGLGPYWQTEEEQPAQALAIYPANNTALIMFSSLILTCLISRL